MIIKMKIEKEYDVKYISVDANVRHWKDGDENLPCRYGDSLKMDIRIETGLICPWPKGIEAEIHYKVTDQCSYSLLDSDMNTIVERFDQYVPNILCPEVEGYNDYIIMKIDGNGQIAKWNSDVSDILESLEDENSEY